MQLTARQFLTQFAHLLQSSLFPRLSEELGEISEQMQLLTSTLALLPVQQRLSGQRCRMGRRPCDRAALVAAFVAKSIYNLTTTRQLIERLRADDVLRRLCGWSCLSALPHEATFSRAFAQFAHTQLPQQLHEALVRVTQQNRLIGHVARDSTAIEVREHFPETKRGRDRKQKRNRKRPRRAKACERGTRIERQRHKSLAEMLAELPRQCAIGVKTSSQGHQQYWRGYKLHLDVADGQIPISAILTSANVNDSQVAIPLMTMSAQRVQWLYDVMDSAYDADAIIQQARAMGRVPIVKSHPRRNGRSRSILPKVFTPKRAPEMTWAQAARFAERTMVERVYARLKDEFGGRQIRVRGAAKVMAHLMFGVIALTVDQWLRLSG